MARLPAADDPRWLPKTVLSRWRWTVPAGIFMAVSFLSNGLSPVIIGRAIDDLDRVFWWIGVLAGTFILPA